MGMKKRVKDIKRNKGDQEFEVLVDAIKDQLSELQIIVAMLVKREGGQVFFTDKEFEEFDNSLVICTQDFGFRYRVWLERP